MKSRREIRLTKDAVEDFRFWQITKIELNAIVDALEKLAECPNIFYEKNVDKIACTGGKWLRLKITFPDQFRVAFTVENDDSLILVQAVLRRTENTYPIIKILYEIKQRKSA